MRFLVWPFVSRERYDERVEEIKTLRAELASERQDNKRLWNYLNWRVGGGVAFDTTMLPEAYQPVPRAAAAPKTDGATGMESLLDAHAPGAVRKVLAKFETIQQQEFDRDKVGAATRVKQDQNEAAREPQPMAGD